MILKTFPTPSISTSVIKMYFAKTFYHIVPTNTQSSQRTVSFDISQENLLCGTRLRLLFAVGTTNPYVVTRQIAQITKFWFRDLTEEATWEVLIY